MNAIRRFSTSFAQISLRVYMFLAFSIVIRIESIRTTRAIVNYCNETKGEKSHLSYRRDGLNSSDLLIYRRRQSKYVFERLSQHYRGIRTNVVTEKKDVFSRVNIIRHEYYPSVARKRHCVRVSFYRVCQTSR